MQILVVSQEEISRAFGLALKCRRKTEGVLAGSDALDDVLFSVKAVCN